jgi:phosphate transport system protein
METRKIQSIGGSSCTVTLPREWTEEHDIDGGSVVRLHTLGGSVAITPERDDEPATERVPIAGLGEDHVSRAIVTLYVCGYDEVVLEGEEVDAERRAAVQEVTNRLTGLQVVDETPDAIRLRSLLDHGEMSTPDVVDRMHTVAGLMLSDAVAAVLDGDEPAAQDVLEREEDINRMYAMVLRWFRRCLRDPAANERSTLALETHFDFHACAKQLERIADHAATIAGLAGETGPIPAPTAESITELRTDAQSVIDRTMAAFFSENPDAAAARANEAMDDVESIDEDAGAISSNLHEPDADRARTVALVVDSIASTAEYGGSIAESARQKTTESPQLRGGDTD